jgi:hypothetical protein
VTAVLLRQAQQVVVVLLLLGLLLQGMQSCHAAWRARQ